MGHLANIWAEYYSAKTEEILEEASDIKLLHGLLVFVETMNHHNASKTFYFAHCAMDQGSSALYAMIKLNKNGDPNMAIPLMKSDLDEIQIAIDEVKDHILDEHKEVFERLESVIDLAIKGLKHSQSAVEFVRDRDRKAQQSRAGEQVLTFAGLMHG